ncbi:hypothetical protein J3F83DRAFT_753587, partial [Trichoderma novae-zelandiae]
MDRESSYTNGKWSDNCDGRVSARWIGLANEKQSRGIARKQQAHESGPVHLACRFCKTQPLDRASNKARLFFVCLSVSIGYFVELVRSIRWFHLLAPVVHRIKLQLIRFNHNRSANCDGMTDSLEPSMPWRISAVSKTLVLVLVLVRVRVM